MRRRGPTLRRGPGVAMAIWAVLAGAAAAECRQALALGLDVSGSVDSREYDLQLGGLAGALESEDVAAVLLSAPELPVHVAVFEWSGPGAQRLLLPWTAIDGPEALASVTLRLRTVTRVPLHPSTALGEAMTYGATLLAERTHCLGRTMDLSGDGRANTMPRPGQVRESGSLDGITVNALAVGYDAPVHPTIQQVTIAELQAYFERHVIHGPGAFVETALGYADFERAMRRKLLRELQGLSIGGAEPGPAPSTPAGRQGG